MRGFAPVVGVWTSAPWRLTQRAMLGSRITVYLYNVTLGFGQICPRRIAVLRL